MTVVDLARTFRLLVGVDTEQERRHIFKRCTGLTCIEQACCLEGMRNPCKLAHIINELETIT